MSSTAFPTPFGTGPKRGGLRTKFGVRHPNAQSRYAMRHLQSFAPSRPVQRFAVPLNKPFGERRRIQPARLKPILGGRPGKLHAGGASLDKQSPRIQKEKEPMTCMSILFYTLFGLLLLHVVLYLCVFVFFISDSKDKEFRPVSGKHIHHRPDPRLNGLPGKPDHVTPVSPGALVTVNTSSSASSVAAAVPVSVTPKLPAPLGCDVLLLMTDQHQHNAFGAAGNKITYTPHLDRLAKEGVIFADATTYVPQCVPSRSVILTGCSSESNSFYHNQAYLDPSNRLQRPVYQSMLRQNGLDYYTEHHGKWHSDRTQLDNKTNFDVPAWTIAELKAEYFKWLLFHGPDGFSAEREKGQLVSKTLKDWPFLPLLLFRGEIGDHIMPEYKENGVLAYMPDWATLSRFIANQTIKSLRAIAKRRLEGKDKRPFALTTSFFHPHAPLLNTLATLKRYNPEDMEPPSNIHDADPNDPYRKWRSNVRMKAIEKFFDRKDKSNSKKLMALYYGVVTEIDDAIGRVLKVLDATGLGSNTLVIYTSDHGEMLSSHGKIDKSPWFYEESIRVPLIMRFPKIVPHPRNVVIRAPVGTIDLAPTIVDYAAQTSINDPGALKRMEGTSVRPLVDAAHALLKTGKHEHMSFVHPSGAIKGQRVLQAAEVPRQRGGLHRGYAVSFWQNDPVKIWGYGYMVRTVNWKLMWNLQHGSYALYDLVSDPVELHNLLTLHLDTRGPHCEVPKSLMPTFQRLSAYLKAWQHKNHHMAFINRPSPYSVCILAKKDIKLTAGQKSRALAAPSKALFKALRISGIDDSSTPRPKPAGPTRCVNFPSGWLHHAVHPKHGCKEYASLGLCSKEGRPLGKIASLSSLAFWSKAKTSDNKKPEWVGVDAAVACCVCGGGVLVPKRDKKAEQKLKSHGASVPPAPFVFRRPPLQPVRRVMVVGERDSGVGWFITTLRNNFDVEIHSMQDEALPGFQVTKTKSGGVGGSFGAKASYMLHHDPKKWGAPARGGRPARRGPVDLHPVLTSTDTLVILLTVDPYAWLTAMCTNPGRHCTTGFKSKRGYDVPIEKCIAMPYKCYDANEAKLEVDRNLADPASTRFQNLVQVRTVKHQGYLLLQKSSRRFLHIKLEKLLQGGSASLAFDRLVRNHHLKAKNADNWKLRKEKLPAPLSWNQLQFRTYMSLYSKKTKAFMKKSLNCDLESSLGYKCV